MYPTYESQFEDIKQVKEEQYLCYISDMDNEDITRKKKQDRDFWLKIASPIFGQNIY